MDDTPTSPESPAEGMRLPADPALAAAVLEIESHVAGDGWDQPSRIYALVETARFVAEQPGLASMMGLDDSSAEGGFTPVEQEELPAAAQVEQVLQTLEWPEGVSGCAVTLERLVLPPDVEAEIPEDPAEAVTFAASHPDRQEVRMVAGATRAGATYCALRMRSHDDDLSVVDGTDLVPGLLQLLLTTLDVDLPDPSHPTPDTGIQAPAQEKNP